MKHIAIAGLVLLVSFAATPDVRAEVITTTFAGGNSGIQGGAVFFDINVLNPSGITVSGISSNNNDNDFNNAGAVGTLEIYARSGTYVGTTGSSSGWALISSGSGVLAATGTPTNFSISSFQLNAGVTGIALVAGANWGYVYTNGNGSNQSYSDANLSLTLGAAMSDPFTGGSLFSPRVWNGSITYATASAVPEPSVIALVGLTCCGAGIRRYRRLRNGQCSVA